jgi:hypothetical protein
MLMLAVPVALAFLARALGSNHSVWQVGAVLCALGLIGCVGVLRQHFLSKWRYLTRADWFLIGYTILVSLVWFAFGAANPRALVHVENGTDKQVVLELDGRQWLILQSGESTNTWLTQRVHQLVVRTTSGEVLDRRGIVAQDEKAYVLNVLGARTYYRGSVTYGPKGGNVTAPFYISREEEKALKDVWIVANVDYLFEEPPETIAVRGSAAPFLTTRTYLTKSPISK